MELTIDQKTLSRMLMRAASVAASKSPLLILTHTLLEATGDTLRVRATDQYIGAELTAQAAVKRSGSAAVDARHVAEVVRSLRPGDVTLKLDKSNLEVRSGATKFRIPTLYAEDFPPAPKLDASGSATLPARELVRLLAQGAYTSREDPSRPYVASCLLTTPSGSNRLRIASTDGHRAAYASAPVNGVVADMLVPLAAHAEIKRMCEATEGDIAIAYAGGYAFFAIEGESLYARLLDEKFPPYERVIPDNPHSLILLRDPLIDMLKRVRIEARNAMNKRRSAKDGKKDVVCGARLVITRESVSAKVDHEMGEAEDAIECSAGFELSIGFNTEYLIEALSACRDDEVELRFDGELDPIVVRSTSDDGYVNATMPMRI